MRSFPFDSIVEAMGDDGLPIYDRSYTAQELRDVMKRIITNGVFTDEANAFQVSPGTGMTVKVKPGACFINGTCGVEDDERVLEFEAATSSHRIDTIVLRWDINIESRKIDLYVRKGAAATAPKRPALTRTGSVYELGIADVYIPASTTSISAERITDTRLENARCGVAAPFMTVDTTSFYEQLKAATDSAIELAQNALDDTTAGYLQSQINTKLDKSTRPLIERGYIEPGEMYQNDTPRYWAERGAGVYEVDINDGVLEDSIPTFRSTYMLSMVNKVNYMDEEYPDDFISVTQIAFGIAMSVFSTSNPSVPRDVNIPAIAFRTGSYDPNNASDQGTWRETYGNVLNGNGWTIPLPGAKMVTTDMLASSDASSTLGSNLSNYFTVSTSTLKKRAGVAMLYLHIKAKQAIPNNTHVADIPSGFLPLMTTTCLVYSPVNSQEYTLRCGSGGKLVTATDWAKDKDVYMCATYLTSS